MQASWFPGPGVTKSVIAMLCCAFIILAVLSVLDHPVQAVQPATAPANPDAASIRLLFNPGDQPTNMDQLRLYDLENSVGILRCAWGMEIPAGKKLVLNFHGGKSSYIYEITGPLAATFGNRISLVRQMVNNKQAEQLALEIRTQPGPDSSLW